MRVWFFVFVVLAGVLLVSSVSAADLPIGLQRLFAYEQEIALSVTFLAAFLAGMISFTSPCGFVLLPMFFSIMFKERKRSVLMTAFFCAGFIVALALLGLLAGYLSSLLASFKEDISVFSGLLIVLFGIMTLLNKGLGTTGTPVAQSSRKPTTAWSVFCLGLFFGFGWTPCVGAVLGGIFFLSFNFINPLMATGFAATFGLGVAVPLLLVAWFADRWNWQKWLLGKAFSFKLFGSQVYTSTYNILAGLFLLVIGMIMVVWQGTGFFMSEIPKVVPWNMNKLVDWNQALVNSSFFTSTTANVLGLVILVAGIVLFVRIIRKGKTAEK